jgi:hypothetical protein
MAINRQVPFEEQSIGKDKTGVVGLQDTAILFSVINHLKGTPPDRYAFISSDAVFHRPETRKLIEDHGVRLETFKTASALFDDLWDHVWDAIRDEWHKEMEQVKDTLIAQKEELSSQILPLLIPSEIGRSFWQNVKEIKSVIVDQIYSAQTELPEAEYRPPQASTYSRPEGSPVKISARVSVDVDVVTVSYPFVEIFALRRRKSDEPEPSSTIEERTISKTLNISLTGEVHNGSIGNFQVTSVQAER